MTDYNKELDLLAEYMDMWIDFNFYQEMYNRTVIKLAFLTGTIIIRNEEKLMSFEEWRALQ